MAKVTTKAPRQTIKGGEVPMPKISQLRGKGMNAGGLPNNLKKSFPKQKVSVPKYSKGGKVGGKCR